ncbi:MAG TPA: type II toxin-antitoxin system ParD family antitoxin [Tepidisphaeraceae bacterium]|jgi:Arc/MetJ-type ribon-helix-helix transcriptional regulator
MNLSLHPDIQRFIDEQVRTGRYPSPEALVEAAIADMRDANETELDDAAIAAINRAEEEADRGEGVDLETFRADFTKRFKSA